MFVRQNLRSLVAVALLIFSAASTGADDCPCGWYASGGHCYKLFPVASKWAQAQQTCKAENANLVSIHNANEAEIVECLRNGEWTWLGLSDIDSEGNYVWTDGTPTDFTDWADHQPDNYHNVENCIHIRDDTKWNDIHCDKLMNFICKLNPCI